MRSHCSSSADCDARKRHGSSRGATCCAHKRNTNICICMLSANGEASRNGNVNEKMSCLQAECLRAALGTAVTHARGDDPQTPADLLASPDRRVESRFERTRYSGDERPVLHNPAVLRRRRRGRYHEGAPSRRAILIRERWFLSSWKRADWTCRRSRWFATACRSLRHASTRARFASRHGPRVARPVFARLAGSLRATPTDAFARNKQIFLAWLGRRSCSGPWPLRLRSVQPDICDLAAVRDVPRRHGRAAGIAGMDRRPAPTGAKGAFIVTCGLFHHVSATPLKGSSPQV